MKYILQIIIILYSLNSHSYPKECEIIENKIRILIEKVENGHEPLQDINALVPQMEATKSKFPECSDNIVYHTKNLKKTLMQMQAKYENLAAEAKKKRELSNDKKLNRSELINYDDWFTLINTKIKNGKKYSFVACVIGPRNATAKSCGLSGTAAKRIFYSTDDIKDIEAKGRWINSINELKCVEAYVTGGQAFVTNVDSKENCIN